MKKLAKEKGIDLKSLPDFGEYPNFVVLPSQRTNGRPIYVLNGCNECRLRHADSFTWTNGNGQRFWKLRCDNRRHKCRGRLILEGNSNRHRLEAFPGDQREEKQGRGNIKGLKKLLIKQIRSRVYKEGMDQLEWKSTEFVGQILLQHRWHLGHLGFGGEELRKQKSSLVRLLQKKRKEMKGKKQKHTQQKEEEEKHGPKVPNGLFDPEDLLLQCVPMRIQLPEGEKFLAIYLSDDVRTVPSTSFPASFHFPASYSTCLAEEERSFTSDGLDQIVPMP